MTDSRIRVGIGGWTFKPWRGVFYPASLRQADELGFASRHLTSIEVNGTFYRTQSRDTFQRWADETPDDFVFSVKGPRYVVAARRLADTGASIERFFQSGVTALGPKLGPVLWQLPPTKKFDEADLAAFVALLPRKLDGRAIRHVVEVRHESFRTPAFIALMRSLCIPIVYADSDTYPAIADVTGDFVYARLMRSVDTIETGYDLADINAWADRLRIWAEGREPQDLPRVTAPISQGPPRFCFVYMINGAKVRAPAGAMALLSCLGSP